jgi:hypothetical protein
MYSPIKQSLQGRLRVVGRMSQRPAVAYTARYPDRLTAPGRRGGFEPLLAPARRCPFSNGWPGDAASERPSCRPLEPQLSFLPGR